MGSGLCQNGLSPKTELVIGTRSLLSTARQVDERIARAGAGSPEGLRQQSVLRGRTQEGRRRSQTKEGGGRARRRARRLRGLHPGGGEDQVLEVPRAAGEGDVRTALQGRGDVD